MRVAIIDPSLFTWPYDAELGLALQREGHEVAIYGTSGSPPAEAAAPLLRPHFYRAVERLRRLPLPHGAVSIAKGLSHVVSMARLVRVLEAQAPDVIHFQWTPLPFVDLRFLPLLRRLAPLVLTVHDSRPFNGNPRSQLQNWGATTIVGRFDQLIVHTCAARDQLAADGIDSRRINVVPHGPLTLPAPPDLANDTPRGTSRTRLLFFGKIKPYKGLDVLIEALAAMPTDLRDRWQLRVVGEPYMDVEPLRTVAQQSGIADQIHFDLRFIPDAEIPLLFAAADLLVLPYRQIDASGVLMMSLSSGLPIVASRLGLFAEVLRDGQHGRLVDPGNPQSLATALGDLIGNPGALPYMGLQVRRLGAEWPDWDEIARRTARIYATAGQHYEPGLDEHTIHPDLRGPQ